MYLVSSRGHHEGSTNSCLCSPWRGPCLPSPLRAPTPFPARAETHRALDVHAGIQHGRNFTVSRVQGHHQSRAPVLQSIGCYADALCTVLPPSPLGREPRSEACCPCSRQAPFHSARPALYCSPKSKWDPSHSDSKIQAELGWDGVHTKWEGRKHPQKQNYA